MSARALVRELLTDVRVGSDHWDWLGERHRVVTDASNEGQSVLRRRLEVALYRDFYICGGLAPADPTEIGSSHWGEVPPVEYDAANQTRGRRRVARLVGDATDNEVSVDLEGVTWRTRRDRVHGPPTPGAWVDVEVPNTTIGRLSGYYVAHGVGKTDLETGPLDRYYLNARPEARARVLEVCTALLTARGIPHRMKVLNDPEAHRCDSAVVYCPAAARAEIRPLVETVAFDLSPLLGARVPALTLPLAPGLGFAEDPPGEDSFGQHRCHLLAWSLQEGRERGAETLDDRMRVVEQCFASQGISIDAPHLNPLPTQSQEDENASAAA